MASDIFKICFIILFRYVGKAPCSRARTKPYDKSNSSSYACP